MSEDASSSKMEKDDCYSAATCSFEAQAATTTSQSRACRSVLEQSRSTHAQGEGLWAQSRWSP
jgi:hypothetical protein